MIEHENQTTTQNRSEELSDWRCLVVLVVGGLILRLLLLPFADHIGGDATDRTFWAWEWAENPTWLFSGTWGPFYVYLFGPLLRIFGHPLTTPIMVNALLGSLTAIPVYLWARLSFTRSWAWFASAVVLLFPLAFHSSLTALSGTPFVFFVAWAMYFLARAMKRDGRLFDALASGFCMTLASGLRYEAWPLMALLALMIIRKPRLFLAFCLAAGVHPLAWMIGCWFEQGDFLYSVNAAKAFQLTALNANQSVSLGVLAYRLAYFPAAFFFGFTPLAAFTTFVGMGVAIRRKSALRVWLLPALGMMAVYMIRALDASLMTRPRFLVLIGVLVAPFAALGMRAIAEKSRRGRVVAIAILLSMLPLSYLEFKPAPALGVINKIIPNQIEAIPRMAIIEGFSPVMQLDRLRLRLREAAQKEGAAILDFIGASESGYLAIHTQLHPRNLYRSYGYTAENPAALALFVHDHPIGVLMLYPGSPLSRVLRVDHTSGRLFIRDQPIWIDIDFIESIERVSLYRYRLNENNPRKTSPIPELDLPPVE